MATSLNYKHLAAILLPGLIIRLLLAPYTSGSDIAQFAAFADTMIKHGLEFFIYSDGKRFASEGWPYPWPYVYGPLFIILLSMLRVLAPGKLKIYYDANGVYNVKIPTDWIIANKIVYILFDSIAAYEIYWIVKKLTGDGRKAVFTTILYYYNPLVIYISSIYGMFDQIVLSLLLAGLILFLKTESELSQAVVWGIAISIKPSIMIAMIPFYVYLAKEKGIVDSVKSIAASVLLLLALFAPFMVIAPEGVTSYYHALEIVSTPNYYSPPAYSFNGLSSIAFYVWIHTGRNTSHYLSVWPILFIPLYMATLYYTFKTRNPILGMMLAQVTYTATYWRVNHQYLVVTIGLVAISLPLLMNNMGELFAVLTIVMPALWPIFYPLSFWAQVHIAKPNHAIISLLQAISLDIYDDLFYVYYSLALTFIQITLILVILLDRNH